MNYERVFTWYIGQAIENMIQDGVMYAELRPMLLDKSIPSDDGRRPLDHNWQMKTIIQQVELKKEQLRKEGRFEKFPFGLKIIYCAPRSIPKPMMQKETQDCIRLKLDFPDLICGKNYPRVNQEVGMSF
jgi:adenosine deaminase CECR1